MSELGKFPLDLIETIVYPRLGAKNKQVLIGPGHGRDNAVIQLGCGQVLILKADPFSVIPALGLKDSAYLSIHLLASDVATSGFPGKFLMVNLSLPPRMTNEEFAEYWKHLSFECEKSGISIVGGHTGRYVGCDFTVVGGGMMMALAPENCYLASTMGGPGEVLIMTKGAAIATTAILSRVFPHAIEKAYGSSFLKKAQGYLRQFSVVQDSLTAASVGFRERGVTAMHDVTEGGLFGALYEFSLASRVGLEIQLREIIVPKEARLVCDLFDLSPYSTLGEGSLIICAKPEKAETILETLKRTGIPCAVIGKTTNQRSGRWIRTDGKKARLEKPGSDPYWEAYWKACKKGWK